MRRLLLLLVACNGEDDVPVGSPAAPTSAGTTPTTPSAPCDGPLALNEASPANHGLLVDHEGDTVDWLEVANPTGSPVDLAGWRLSDEADEPWKWTFPPLVLGPGEVELVYASGKGTARAVATWDTRIDLGDTWRYLPVEGPVEGWRLPGFDDGSWPVGPSGFGRGDGDDATEVETHTIYARTTFSLTEEELADLVTMLLHVDYDDGFAAWLDGVEVARANLGAVGTEPAWDAWATGEHEVLMKDGLVPDAFDLEGVVAGLVAGEHVLTLEVHDASADSSDVSLAVSAGVEIHGGWTRAHEQKNLDLQFDPGWGGAPVAHDVFPGLDVTTFDRLLLRAAGNDWLGCFKNGCSEGANLRDGLVHRLVEGLDLDVMAYRPAELYLNGEWWGIYELREKPDLSYVVAHHGAEDIDLLEMNAKVVEGDAVAWEALMDLLRTQDPSDPAVWAEVEAQIDVQELAKYLAVELFVDNTDWPGNNVKWWRPRAEGGRWRWLLYDTDFGLGAGFDTPDHDTLAFALADVGPGWESPPSEMFGLMLTSTQFVEVFANVYADLMNTTLDPGTTGPVADEVVAGVEPLIARHEERWGSWTDGVETHTLEEGAWPPEIDWIDQWLAERPAWARAHVVTNLGLPGTFPLRLEADPPGAGTFRLAVADVEAPFEGVYFQGVPVTITAVPAQGRTFAGWSDPGLPADAEVAITAASGAKVTLVARFE